MMIPPLWLISVWRVAKPLLPYIAIAVMVAGGLWWVHGRGVASGKASRNGEVIALTTDRDTAVANTLALRASVTNQNAAIDRIAEQGSQAMAEADAAAKAGQARAKALAGLKMQLEALAAVKGPCTAPLPKAISDAWIKLK